jgi:hypothetical protein
VTGVDGSWGVFGLSRSGAIRRGRNVEETDLEGEPSISIENPCGPLCCALRHPRFQIGRPRFPRETPVVPKS